MNLVHLGTGKIDLILPILHQVDELLKYDELQPTWLEFYQNGRETGFCLCRGTRKVVFAEFRRSDDIVVYFGKSLEFDMRGNIPRESVYEDKSLFQPDAAELPASIYQRLIE